MAGVDTVARYALPVWTLLIWTTRIRNVVDDGGSAGDLLVPVALTLLAVAALVDRHRALLALAAVTVVVWAVRVPLLLTRDHSAAFVVVHLVLAVVSVGLAVLAWRAVRSSGQRDRAGAAAG